MEELYNQLYKSGLYTKSYADFQKQFNNEKGAESLHDALASDRKYTKGLQSFKDQFKLGLPAPVVASPEQSAPEEVNAITAASNLEAQDWWGKNADLGGFSDYKTDEEGRFVNEKGGFTLWKEYIKPNTLSWDGQYPNAVKDGDGKSFVWKGLEDETRTKELAQQLEKQTSQVSASESIEKAEADMESDPLEKKIKETNRQSANFFADSANEGINKDDWEYAEGYPPGRIIEKRTRIEYSASNLPNGDERYLDVIDILKKESEADKGIDQRAKSLGRSKVKEITAGDLSTKENWALDNLNETNLDKMGFTVTDENWEAGYGELTITSKEGKKYKIKTGGGASEDDIAFLNRFLKDNAYDFGSKLAASVATTNATPEQVKKNKAEAVVETSKVVKIKELKKNEDRDAQDTTAVKARDKAARQIGYESWEKSPLNPNAPFSIRGDWTKNMERAFDDILKQMIADNIDSMGDLGFKVQRSSEIKGRGALETITGGLFTGYQITDRFIKNNQDVAAQHDNAIESEAKRQFINRINEELEKNGFDQLSSEDVKKVMNTSKDKLEGMYGLPGSVMDVLSRTSNISFTNILKGVATDNDSVLSEVEGNLTSGKNGESIKKNIYENIEGRSGNYWSDEDFKNNLEKESAARWEELKEKDKTLVAASEELRGNFKNNTKLLEESLNELKALKFNGLSAEEAIKELSSKEYNSKEKADAANAKAKEIANAYNASASKVRTYADANENYVDLTIDMRKDMEDLGLEIEDLSWYKDVINDRTALGFQMADALLNGAVEIGQAFIELGGIVSDVNAAAIGWVAGKLLGAEANEAVDDWYSETAFGDRRVQTYIDEWQEEGVLGEKAQTVIGMDDIDSFEDFGEWAAVTLSGQIPQLAMMVGTSGLGSLAFRGAIKAGTMTAARAATLTEIFSLSTMGATSMGTKYKSMREEDLLYKESGGLYGMDYSLGQMLLVSGGTGVVEAVSERCTYDLMKGMGGSFAKKLGSIKDAKSGYINALRKEFLTKPGMMSSFRGLSMTAQEGFSEGYAALGGNLFDIVVGGKQDVHIFDNVKEGVVTGLMMGGAMSSPALFRRVINPFTSVDAKKQYTIAHLREQQLTADLKKLLNDPNADLGRIEEIRDDLVKNAKDLAVLKELSIKRVDLFSDTEIKTLINIDRQNEQLSRKYHKAGNNKSLTEAQVAEMQKKFEDQYNDNLKKKDKIINQYDVNVVDRKYKQFVKRTKQLAENAARDGGIKTVTKEHGRKSFAEFVQKHDTPEAYELEAARQRKKLNDPKTSKEQKVVINQNIAAIEDFVKLLASKNADGAYGAMVPILDPKTGKLNNFEIAINKNAAVVGGKYATAVHEFGHAVVYNTIKQDAGVQDVFGTQISELITSGDVKFTKPEYENDYWDTVSRYESEGRGEEQFMILSEMMSEKKLKFNDGVGKKLMRYIRHVQHSAGVRDFEFNNQDDLKDFILSFHKTVNAKFGRNRALEKMQREGARPTKGKRSRIKQGEVNFIEAGLAITKRRNAAKAKHTESKAKIAFSRALDRAEGSNPDMKDTFDKFVQNDDGTRKYEDKDDFNASVDRGSAALEIMEGRALDGLIQQGMTELGLPPQALREFTREVKENLMDRFLIQFDPAKNDSLFGWLTGVSGGRGMSQIYRAKGDVMNKYKSELDTVSIDAPMGEGQSFADTIVDSDSGGSMGDSIGLIEDANGLTIFLESINASPKVVEAINKVVADANVDITGLTYKDVKKLTTAVGAPLSGILDIVAENFGVPPAKVIKPADLSTKQRSTAQEFIKNNAQELIDMLPEGETRSGQATGVANTKLKNLYVKGKRLKMAEGATAAGKFSQNKREDISVEEFNSLFGIRPDGSFDNSRKHDGAIKAIVNQAAMITANQTLRQQAIENESNPMSQIAMLGEGKGTLMFSKKGDEAFMGLGKLLPDLGAAVFLNGTNRLSKNVLSGLTTIEEGGDQKSKEKFAKEAIQGAIVATYSDFFSDKQIDKLVNAIHAVATSNKIPKTEGEKKVKALELQLDRLIVSNETKTKLWFGTGVNTIDLYNNEAKIKLHRGLATKFMVEDAERISNQESNPVKAGVAVLRSMLMLRQQMSTSAVVGGKRAQLFLGKEFLEIMGSNIPGLEFSIKKDDTGWKIDFSKPVTYKGQELGVTASDFKLDAQTGMSVLKSYIADYFDDTTKLSEREAGVIEAREHMDRYIAFHVGLYHSGITTAEDLQMVAANLLSNMNPSLARAAMPKFIGKDMLPPNWKSMTKKQVNSWLTDNLKGDLKPVFEHMQPRLSVVLGLFEAHLFDESGESRTIDNPAKINIEKQFANYDVAIISDRMDKALKAAGLNNSLAEGQTLTMESWIRYYNEATMATGRMKSLIGIGSNAGVDVGDAHVRVASILNKKRENIKQNALANGVLMYSKVMDKAFKASRSGTKKLIDGLVDNDVADTLADAVSGVNPDGYSNIRFSRSHRAEYEQRLIKNRAGLNTSGNKKVAEKLVDDLFKWLDSPSFYLGAESPIYAAKHKSKFEKLALHYMVHNKLILPEDGFKVIEAERLARVKKLDPFSFKNPNEIIERYSEEVDGRKTTNPDNVEAFTNKRELANGITMYNVDNSSSTTTVPGRFYKVSPGQQAVRDQVDQHFGEKSNPWCIVQSADGKLTEQAGEYWDQYGDKQILFKDGKLLAMRTESREDGFSDEGDVEFWSRDNVKYNEIPGNDYVDEQGRTVRSSFDEKTGKETGILYGATKGSIKSGKIEIYGTYTESKGHHHPGKTRYLKNGEKPQLYLEYVERYNKDGEYHGISEEHTNPTAMKRENYESSIITTREYNNGEHVETLVDYGDGKGLSTRNYARFTPAEEARANEIQFSKSAKGITVLDFDDTLATTKSGVKARIPNPDGTPKPGRKVIFMAGGAGSGKGNVISKLGFKKAGYKLVNSDISLEWLKKNHGMPENQTDYTAEQRSQLSKLSAEARKIAKRKQGKFAGNGDGVVVDGTGGSIKMMEKLVQEFKAKGYDVSMVFVETSLEVAQQRNAARTERSIREGILNKNHEQVQGNKEAFKALFGETFNEVSTDKIGFNDALPEGFKKKVDDFTNSYENRRLDAEEFARDGEGIKANGGEFDFSEFNKVLGGETAPLFNKAMKLYGKFGAENMFVLTARAPESQLAIKEFLDAQGLDIPLKNITGLGNSEASAKANWIAEKVGEGYNDFYFADDAIQNVDAVREKLNELEVKNKVQQAKIQFSMNTKRDLKWNSKSATRFLLDEDLDDFTAGKIHTANFKVGDNTYNIRLTNRSLNVSNRFVKGDSVFDLEFALENQTDELWEGAGKMGLEGTGRASEVLSIVSNGVMDFIKNNNVDAIGFTSAPGFDDATSRTRLYSTLTKFWASKLGWEWTSESETHQEDGKDINSGKFIISNPNPSDLMVDEASDKTAFWYRSTEEKSMLNMFDVKGKAQQARIKFSKSGPKKMSDIIDESELDLNKILEETKGVGKNKAFSAAKARQRGKGKGRFKFFVPPSADDFAGLMYAFMGKGKQGDKHHAWFKKNLFDPFSKGMRRHKIMQQQVASDMKNLRKAIPEVRKKLNKKVPGAEFTYEDAIRIHNWVQAGLDIPGLSAADQQALVNAVKASPDLSAFAMGVNSISSMPGGMVDPGPHWTGGNIALDLKEALDASRSTHLQQWIENKNVIFNEANMNKIEAVYGPNFREALEDSLWRMENGGTRSKGGRIVNNFTNWIHGSIGTTMFLNARSAVLQMISNVNFVNWSDNNMVAAAGAFANQKQYWGDVSMIFNSPFLKQRRSGIQTDVNAAELLAQIKDSRNKLKAATAYLLQLGFTPTQIADSFAIATGGATFYRNRMKTYLKEGMAQAEAETKAFNDMMEIAEETQQSTREDKISQQQASPLGKFILAFQNTPMQYNRLIKKAAQDLVNGRGDPKVNISRIIYYAGIQNLIFYGLQAALFAALFSDDEEDEITDTKKERVVNGMLDTLLRGSGIGGAVVATVKNVILKFMKESEKMDDGVYYTGPDWGNVIIEGLNIAPPIGIKARKIYSGLKTWEYNKDVIDQMDKTDIDNPIYDAAFSVTEAVTNVPLSRLYNKTQNISESLDAEHETWKRVAMLLGWSRWNFGIKNQDVVDAKGEVKEIKAKEAVVKAEKKKIIKAEEKAVEDAVVVEENIKIQKEERKAVEKATTDEEKKEAEKNVTCAAVSRSGNRCAKKPKGGGSYCTIHESVPAREDGVKSQCSHVKPDGKRCKMQTNNKSGKCYYHD
jgi:predicted kinase